MSTPVRPGLFLLSLLALLTTSCMAPPESKEKAWLRMCEEQVKALLPYPDTYQPASAAGSDFVSIPRLTNQVTETVAWDFFYEGEKAATVVGQAGDRPLLKGVGQCEINKRTGHPL